MVPVAKVFPETQPDLFEKVFGKNQEIKKIKIAATYKDLYLGEIEVTILGEKIQSLSGIDLEKILHDKIIEERVQFYPFKDKIVDPPKLPFKIKYIPSELRMVLELPPDDLKPLDANVFDDLIPYYSQKSTPPAPFSFGTNYKLEDTQIKNLDQPHLFQVQTDTFMNVKNVTIENQMNYLSTRHETPWYRQNSKLVYDRPEKMQRMEVGDVTYPILGFQRPRSLGGASFYRDFSLNPYRATRPTSSFEYVVETRSLVRTYVNNTILKTEYMNPGKYTVRDIPLNNGINKIIVEMTDDFGKKKVLIFNEAGSIDLLASGLSRYSLAAGFPTSDNIVSKKYNKNNGAFVTGLYQHGVNKNWSAGAYSQGNKKFTLLGINNILATRYGNWIFDTAGSKQIDHGGVGAEVIYQLHLFGSYWYNAHTLTTKIEYLSLKFSEDGESVDNRFDFLTSASYSVPLFEKFNAALSSHYYSPRIGSIAPFGFDTSLSAKILESSSLTFYFSRNRDENKLWSTQLYFFLNMTFGESSNFVSAFYDKQSETKRLTVLHDSGKQLETLKVSGSVNESESLSEANLDLQYNTTLADLGAREEVIQRKGNKMGTRTSFRFLSSFAFVHNGHESGFSLSRPISNSYVLFKPNDSWIGQRFGVQSQRNEVDDHTGLFGESLISGLTPYQYHRLQLDPSRLEPGYILGQESFVVYPRYRSGHLFVVGKSGLLVLRGVILDQNKNPLPLKVGFWTSATGKSTPFFTGREGEFTIEGVEATKGKIQLDDEIFDAREVNLEPTQIGLIDIGSIELILKENRL
jgi:outer membrane usher protein